MEPTPVVRAHDPATLRAAVAAEDRQADLSDAVVRSGWENVVLETPEWIYRFPRDDGVDFRRELAILTRLDGRLPAAIPRIEWVGERTRFAAYRKLVGSTFDDSAYAAAPARDRDALADSLAAFLAAMHDAMSPEEIERLRIPRLDRAATALPDPDRLPPAARDGIDALLADHESRWRDQRVPGPDVLLHNDFHFGNIVLAGPVGAVTGVWDFSCVAIGRPTFDLRYFEGDSLDVLERIAARYERATGRAIDIGAAMTANRVELVTDTIDTGDTAELIEAKARWEPIPERTRSPRVG